MSVALRAASNVNCFFSAGYEDDAARVRTAMASRCRPWRQ